jgi:hypothetical protein
MYIYLFRYMQPFEINNYVCAEAVHVALRAAQARAFCSDRHGMAAAAALFLLACGKWQVCVRGPGAAGSRQIISPTNDVITLY